MMNLDKILNTNEVIENYIHSIWKLTETYIRLNLEFWRWLRTILAQSEYLEATENYIQLNLEYLDAIENYIWLNLNI